jgi:hypothetical protein
MAGALSGVNGSGLDNGHGRANELDDQEAKKHTIRVLIGALANEDDFIVHHPEETAPSIIGQRSISFRYKVLTLHEACGKLAKIWFMARPNGATPLLWRLPFEEIFSFSAHANERRNAIGASPGTSVKSELLVSHDTQSVATYKTRERVHSQTARGRACSICF